MGKVIMEPALVNSFFKCPLCKELLRSATVINECFHRFCRTCITDYFETPSHKACPQCQMVIANPLQTLKSDLTFQRLLYKVFDREIACRSSLITVHKSTDIQIDTKIYVNLEHWDISLDLFPHESSTALSKCYLECLADTPLSSIEKLLRIKYALSPTLKIDLFYQSFLLNTDVERLIDVCYCFDTVDKSSPIDIRFVVSPYGYRAICQRVRQSKQSMPLQVEISPPAVSSSLSSTSSMDSTLKVKICRSQSSTNDWYIPQPAASIVLPDLVNSCESQTKLKKLPLKKKSPGLSKPRRRIRFIPTMVKVPPSIFDRLGDIQYGLDLFPLNETIVALNQKSICKVAPFVSEYSSRSEPCFVEKFTFSDSGVLDLSLK